MATNDTRPVNLDLTKFSFPVTAIASITHRVCAVITWVGVGFALYALNAASSPTGFADLQALLSNSFIAQFIAWGLMSAFGYYCLGTAKHLIQDLGYFEDFAGGKMISWAALIGGGVLTVIAGVVIWA